MTGKVNIEYHNQIGIGAFFLLYAYIFKNRNVDAKTLGQNIQSFQT